MNTLGILLLLLVVAVITGYLSIWGAVLLFLLVLLVLSVVGGGPVWTRRGWY